METVYSQAVPTPDATPPGPCWLAAARHGEEWAWERFYHEFQPVLYTLCLRLLHGREDAEDAVQATFVRAFRALPGFRGDSTLRTWLYRIATREAISILRKRPSLADAGEGAMDDLAGPDDAATTVERLAVRAALARLSPDHRVILALRVYEELSYDEIAAVLGITVAAVKMRLNRARNEFRRHYEERS